MTPRPGHPSSTAPALSLILLGLSLLSRGATARTPNLALTIEPDGPFTGVPRSFAVFLTNTTDHILRLPRPYLDCSAIPHGTLYLRLKYEPSGVSRRILSGRGCTADFLHSRDSILQRIASWETLLPGQSLTTHAVLPEPETTGEPGTYTLFADYVPPYVTAYEKAELTQRRIDLPNAALQSPRLVYTVHAKARR